ncbi:hypothetical protein D3C85_1018710 [compost metagenome]
MMPGLITAKVESRGNRNMFGFEEMSAEREGITAELADIGVQIERALGLDGDPEAQFAQGWQQEIPTTTELGATFFENANGCGFKAGQGSVLSHARGAYVEILREFLQFTDCRFRRHQPAESPTGHAEILGKTIQHKGAVIDFQHAGRIGAVGQAVVDLVHHQMTMAFLDRTGQPGQLITGQDRPRRIGRRRDQRTHAVVVPIPLDQIRRQLITHIRTYRNKLRSAFHQAQEMPVARVTRIRQQPVLARIHQQGAGQQQRAGTARRDEDATRVDVQPITLLIKARNGLTQLGNSARGGVARLPRRQCRLTGTDDRFGGGEVRFADFQVNHIVTGGL